MTINHFVFPFLFPALFAASPQSDKNTPSQKQAPQTTFSSVNGAAATIDTASVEGDNSEAGRKPKRQRLSLIVIDPGHGGRDAGAVGTNGYMEKQATLGIALKLGAMIEDKMPGVKVVYTRHTDSFVELYRRGQIANEKKADLFISIHCNSTPAKPSTASGFTTYILRPGRTDAAIKVAAKENAVISYEKKRERYYYLSDVDFILTSMARSQDVRYSEKFASHVQKELHKKLKIKNNGVSQAGFYVLVGASMPNVLIETAFISNPKEEALLKSSSGQTNFAEGIFAAIKAYKKIYEAS